MVTMRTLHRAHKPAGVIIRIPGGWQVRIARIEAESWLPSQWAGYLARSGMPLDKARALAHRCVLQTFASGYLEALREAVWRRACEYHDMWPDHVVATGDTKGSRPIVALRGFDPARIAECYIPINNLGKKVRRQTRALLADMGQRALIGSNDGNHE